MKPKLVWSWGPSWLHVGGLGASWDTLRRSSGDLKAMLSHAKASSPPAQRAANAPVSKNRCAFAFNMFICLQIACMILLTAVPLDWFACLLFVFFSERFPFICRAGLCLGRCWANFCCYLQCFGHPDPKTKAINIFKIEPKLASCWRPKNRLN